MSKSESRKTDSVIVLRCTSEVKERLKEKASLTGLSLSSYLIKTGLSRKIVNRSQYKALAQINRVAALQKHLFNEGKKVGDKEYSEVLYLLKEAANLLISEIEQDDT
ncbi:plasmid mobilization protein MobA [Photorhabdus hainanensis]|uniref:plasmid mobilization protein MobA n=1 Tax=Photorhabdus hainanensis TaxID=1004166 RepID=UPI001BD1C8C4|nr:plasmid mobilization protein MobA [Photorhabdus hainanensis]MBS9434868.1 NikA [Photorhabdus hainanensis]